MKPDRGMDWLNMLVAGVWHFMPGGPLRWLVCILIIAVPCVLLSRRLRTKKKFEIRTYSFAD